MAKKVLEIEFRGSDAGVLKAMQDQGVGADKLRTKLVELQTASTTGGQARGLAVLGKYQDDIAAIQARSSAARLRLMGRDLDAELILIEENAKSKKAAVERTLSTQLRRAPNDEYAERLKTSAAEKSAAVDAAAAEQKAALVTRQSTAEAVNAEAKRLALAREFQSAELSALTVRAQGGDKAAAADLRRLEAVRLYQIESSRILDLLKGQTLTIEQQLRAERALVQLQDAAFGRMQAKDKESNTRGGGGGGRNQPAGFLGQLNSEFGRGSTFGVLGRIARGAGPVLAFTIAADIAGNAAEKIKEINSELRSGKIGASQYTGALAEGLVQSIPLLSNIYGGLRSVFSLFIDDGEAVMRHEAVRTLVLDQQTEAAKRQRIALRELAEFTVTSNARINRAGLVGFGAESFDIHRKGFAEIEANTKERQNALDANEKIRLETAKQMRSISSLSNVELDKLIGDLNNNSRDQADRINKEWDQRDAQTRAAAGAEEMTWYAEHERNVTKAINQTGSETNAIYVNIQAERLKRLGLDLEAELLLIRANADAKKREVDLQLVEDTRNAPASDAYRLRLAAEERKRAIDSSATGELSGLALTTVMAAQTSALQTQADAGNAFAASELKRVAAIKEYTRTAAALQLIVANTLLGDERRREALQAINDLGAAYVEINNKDLRDETLQSPQLISTYDKGASILARHLELDQSIIDLNGRLQSILTNQFSTIAQINAALALQAKLRDIPGLVLNREIEDEQLKALQLQVSAGDKLNAGELKRLEFAHQVRDLEQEIAALRAQGANAQANALQAQVDAAKKQFIETSLHDQRLELLKAQSEYGPSITGRLNAKKDLARERITDEIKSAAGNAAAILNDPNATGAQKQQALADLQARAQLTGREYSKDVFGDQKAQSTRFDLQERGFGLTGVSAAAQEARNNPLADIARDSKEGLAIQRQMLQLALQLVHQNHPGRVAPGAGNKANGIFNN